MFTMLQKIQNNPKYEIDYLNFKEKPYKSHTNTLKENKVFFINNNMFSDSKILKEQKAFMNRRLRYNNYE